MNKILFSSLMALFITSSCVKERTCECVFTNGGGVASSGQITGKRKESKQFCEAQSSSTTQCRLK